MLSKVIRISKERAERWVLQKHYIGTLGMFWEAFGLVEDGAITGVAVYGQPSPAIQKHAFEDRDFAIYELTRLVIQSADPNAASFLVSRSLKMLKRQPCAVVSYADTKMGHCGIVYQATNWIYTGEVTPHGAGFIVDGEYLHQKVFQDRFGVSNPAEFAKANDYEIIEPTVKHRYFTFVGSKLQKRAMRKKLKYPVVTPYPKCQYVRYDDGPAIMDLVSPFMKAG